MITKIQAFNFKSLHGTAEEDCFSLDLGKFTCLIGPNGCGKSTILQFFDFVFHIFSGNIDNYFHERNWDLADITFKGFTGGRYNRHRNIILSIHSTSSTGSTIKWHASYNKYSKQCTTETFVVNDNIVFSATRDKYITNNIPSTINFEYTGSIISTIKEDALPKEVVNLKKEILNIKSLELLAPHLLRKRSRGKASDIGRGGENIASYISTLDSEQLSSLWDTLRDFYPRLDFFLPRGKRAGWKELIFSERCTEKQCSTITSGIHASDGLMRLLAIVAESRVDHAMLLLDEIENGVTPEVLGKLVQLLIAIPSQTLVTTHSPVILNYLDDETAIQSVQFIYKDKHGFTRSTPFFSIPQIAEKLHFMGPGEVFADTSLQELSSSLGDE